MKALQKRIEEAACHMDPSWTTLDLRARESALVEAIRRRRRRRRGTAAAGGLIAIAAALWLAILSERGPSRAHPESKATETPSARSLVFDDGSAVVFGTNTVLRRVATDDGTLAIELARGWGTFDVVRREERSFRVVAGEVVVEVLGTRFFVEREGKEVRVAVASGEVWVTWPTGETHLRAGESGTFPPSETTHVTDPTPTPSRDEARARRAVPPSKGTGSWRTLAHRGEFRAAYEALSSEGENTVLDEPHDLLLAADVARLTGHPREAVDARRRLLTRHRRDARAPLAAFTLGRVLLDELGDPRQAAEAFAAAQTLDPTGPLVENAIAREVEAWWRAGEPARARERAEEYLRRYPHGSKEKLVRHYGGL